MKNKPNRYDLGKKISELIQNGILITDEVMHYIDSTFSNPSVQELRRILSDPSNCEADTVFELIFYPDLPLQEKIEPILTSGNYNEKDIEPAVRYLSQKKITVPVTFPDQRGTLSLQPTDSIIRQLLVRLNITQQLDPRLSEALSRYVTDTTENLRIRVMLRNCRTKFSDSICDFLCACFKKMYAASPLFWSVFRFLLNFLDYADPKADIYSCLMEEKKAVLQSIDHAEKSEQALKHNSVEALMLKGMTILSINIADARQRIVLIDHICISIFGKTELYGIMDPIETPVTVTDFSPEDFPSP